MPTPAKKNVPSLEDLSNKEGSKDDSTNNPPVVDSDDSSESSKDEAKKDSEVKVDDSTPVINKTPAQMSNETPDETAKRYNLKDPATKEDLEDPQVQVYKDDRVYQIPSSTHLHPDIVRDLQNRGIARPDTDHALVTRQVVEAQDFAGNAEQNDKM